MQAITARVASLPRLAIVAGAGGAVVAAANLVASRAAAARRPPHSAVLGGAGGTARRLAVARAGEGAGKRGSALAGLPNALPGWHRRGASRESGQG